LCISYGKRHKEVHLLKKEKEASKNQALLEQTAKEKLYIPMST
jgi:hypothetical protein